MREVKARPFWFYWCLRDDVWQRHRVCQCEQEAVAESIAMIDSRVGDLLMFHRRDRDFGCVTRALLAVASKEFWGDTRDFPGVLFDSSRYVPPPWHMKGVDAAHDRLSDWADRALRFRGRLISPPTSVGTR